jgi:hypothetical protein
MRSVALALVSMMACGGGAATTDAPPAGDGHGPDGGALTEWLQISGNHILLGNGQPFHGRGANLHDERSCEACAFAPRAPDGVNRWADELIDHWHANFIRFLLAAKPAPFNAGELQWKNLVDDPAYLADVVSNVHHMTSKPGVYVEVTLFADDTVKPNTGDADSEWPYSAGDTDSRYAALAEAFFDDPHVLFGLTNEPHGPANRDADLAVAYQRAIATIRAVEDRHGTPHHVIVAQAPEGYARDLTYFVAHPLTGDQLAYEIHPYNPQTDFDKLIVQPAKTLPIIIGEYGIVDAMLESDVQALWSVAQTAGVPYLAWNFHMRCPPNLLQDTAADGCGLLASTGYAFPRTAWGDLLYAHLGIPW